MSAMPDDDTPQQPAAVIGVLTATASLDVTPAADLDVTPAADPDDADG